MPVQDERPPPVITISDPNRPLAPGDVMESGSERDPWRPSRGQLKAVAFLLLLAAAAVVPDRVVRSRAEAERAQVRAAEAVRVSLTIGDEDASTDALTAVVSNDGPDPVRVLDVQVAGYETVEVDQEVPSLRGRDVRLPDTVACSDRLLQSGTSSVATVRVRTEAGRVVTRRADVPEPLWLPLISLAQHRCGYLAPQDALSVDVQALGSGKDLRLRLTVSNASKVPFELGYLAVPFPGLSATPVGDFAAPVVVPVGGRPAVTTFRVTVDDCEVVRTNQDLVFGEQTLSLEATAYRAATEELLSSGPVFVPSASLDARLLAFAEASCGRAS